MRKIIRAIVVTLLFVPLWVCMFVMDLLFGENNTIEIWKDITQIDED